MMDERFEQMFHHAAETAPEGVDRIDFYTSEGALLASATIEEIKFQTPNVWVDAVTGKARI